MEKNREISIMFMCTLVTNPIQFWKIMDFLRMVCKLMSIKIHYNLLTTVMYMPLEMLPRPTSKDPFTQDSKWIMSLDTTFFRKFQENPKMPPLNLIPKFTLTPTLTSQWSGLKRKIRNQLTPLSSNSNLICRPRRNLRKYLRGNTQELLQDGRSGKRPNELI